jgi:hypothetical protein
VLFHEGGGSDEESSAVGRIHLEFRSAHVNEVVNINLMSVGMSGIAGRLKIIRAATER